MKKITLLLMTVVCVGLISAQSLPITATFNNAIPEGWTYITNNSQYPDPDYYKDGELKLNFEGMGVESPIFAAQSGVTVTINIAALNENTKTAAASTDLFTFTALSESGEVVNNATLQSLNVGNNTVNLSGEGIVKVKVIMTGYPHNGNKYCNVSLASVTVSASGGTNLSSITANTPSFYVSGNNLIVKNVKEGTTVDIYSAVGTKVQSSVVVGNSVQLNNPLTKGIYIIKAGKHTQKIMF